MARFLLLLGLVGLLASGLACEAERDVPETPTVTPEAVERYRTGVTVQMQEIDSAIAALETAAEQADSTGAVAYGRALDALRQERQAIQADLDALQTLTTGAFDEATDALDERIDELEERVDNARIELAQDAAQLRQATLVRLEALDREVQEVQQASAGAEALAELQLRRQQIEAELGRLGAPDVSFTEIRANVARAFDDLFDRLDDLRAPPEADVEMAPAE